MIKNAVVAVLAISLIMQSLALHKAKTEILDKTNQIDYIKFQVKQLLQNCK